MNEEFQTNEILVLRPVALISPAYDGMIGKSLADLVFPRVPTTRLTPAEREARERERKQRERLLQARTLAQRQELRRRAAGNNVALAVLSMHEPHIEYGEARCPVCVQAWLDEPATWPCPTVRTVNLALPEPLTDKEFTDDDD